MKLRNLLRNGGENSGFTMVEIAIAVAIIAFALVAIIGVLPAGLQVQKENREDTLLAQDGTYFMEALRSGSLGLDELPSVVSKIEIRGPTFTNFYPSASPTFGSGAEIIGLLSTPGTINVATVRAISGALAEKGAATSEIAFRYQLQVQILPFDPPALATNAVPEDGLVQRSLSEKLHEVRMLFRWPILANGNLGNGRQVLRSLVSGDLVAVTNNNIVYFYLRP